MSPPIHIHAPETLERLHCLKARGPYQDWLARSASDAKLPGLVVARLPHLERPDTEALSERLSVAAAAARQLEHQNVLHCYGTVSQAEAGIAQILELNTGMDLEQLFAFMRKKKVCLPKGVITWVVREAAEAVAHAHSLGIVHGCLSPSLIALMPGGEVKVDFGLAAGASLVDDPALTDFVDLRYTRPQWTAPDQPRMPQMDVWALGAILLEGLTGEPPKSAFTDDETHRRVNLVPDELREPLGAALSSEAQPRAATHFVNALTRVFYKTLGGEDQRHGREPLLQWVHQAGGMDPAVAGALNDHADTVYPLTGLGKPSEFTQALVARQGPVRPRDFSTDDFVADAPAATWPPATSDAPPATEAVPQIHGVPEPPASELQTQAVSSAPDLMAPDLMLPTPNVVTYAPQSSSISQIRLRRPSRLNWFLAGFAVTLILLVAARNVLNF